MKNFLKGLFKDIIDQAWTLLGMAVAWLVLEGSAKDLTGKPSPNHPYSLGTYLASYATGEPEEEKETGS